MAKCKHCRKSVGERHYCEPQKAVVQSGSSGFIDGVIDAVGEVLEAAVDSLDFD